MGQLKCKLWPEICLQHTFLQCYQATGGSHAFCIGTLVGADGLDARSNLGTASLQIFAAERCTFVGDGCYGWGIVVFYVFIFHFYSWNRELTLDRCPTVSNNCTFCEKWWNNEFDCCYLCIFSVRFVRVWGTQCVSTNDTLCFDSSDKHRYHHMKWMGIRINRTTTRTPRTSSLFSQNTVRLSRKVVWRTETLKDVLPSFVFAQSAVCSKRKRANPIREL